MHGSTTVRRQRSIAVVLAMAVVVAGLGGGAPAAAATGTGACASHLVPATAFTDTVTTTHRAAIDCAVWWELAQGRSASAFAPGVDVTRGQTAAMIAGLLRATGDADGAPDGTSGFQDVIGHRFESDIDLLASLGIAGGLTATRFAPDEPITRAQMASLLARTFELGYRLPLADGPVPFTDVPAANVHRAAIGALVAAGITTGTTATTFTPGGRVSRGQMASFVTRSADVLLDAGRATRPTARPGATDAYATRMRAAWVHLFDDTLKTRAGIRRMVDELAAADASAVIVQVARRHDAYYTSQVLPRTPDPRLESGLDILAELLPLARARGIEVHAWVGVGPTYHDVYRGLTAPAGWMHTTHGIAAPVAERWVSRTADGTWSTYLDPGVPQVQDHVAAVVGELAANYDLDGIHLDYVRYESASHGFNPLALAAYRAETGATATPAATDAAFATWRREQTRRVVLRAREAIAGGADGRDIQLTAAVITWGAGPATPDRAGFVRSLPFTRTLQDWDGWVRRGEVDAVMPMNYFRAHDAEQARWFEGWLAYERALARDVEPRIVPGPGGYLNRPSNVLAQVRAGMAIDGAAVYSYQQPTEDGSRAVWAELARTRWGYHPRR
jgi:uncharacterized lipoprotein YddW (UPF0748 family)